MKQIIGVRIRHNPTGLFRAADGTFDSHGKTYNALGHAKASIGLIVSDITVDITKLCDCSFITVDKQGVATCESVPAYIIEKLNKELKTSTWDKHKDICRRRLREINNYCIQGGITANGERQLVTSPFNCPCCNENAEVLNRVISGKNKVNIQCTKCGLNTGFKDSLEKSLSIWNKREYWKEQNNTKD